MPYSIRIGKPLRNSLVLSCGLLFLISGMLARVYFPLQQQWDNVILLGNLSKSSPVTPDKASPYLQGVAAYLRGDYTDALHAFRALSLNDDRLSRHWIASSLAASGQWVQAIAHLDSRYSHDRDLIASILLPRLSLMPETERTMWEQFIRDSVPEVALKYAAILLANREYEQAEKWIYEVPDYKLSSEALLILGQSYFYRSGQIEASVRIFGDAYNRSANPATAYWLGRAYVYNGQIDAAIPLLEDAVDRLRIEDSTSAWYILELAGAYAKTGNCQGVASTIARLDKLAERIHVPTTLMAGRAEIMSRCME